MTVRVSAHCDLHVPARQVGSSGHAQRRTRRREEIFETDTGGSYHNRRDWNGFSRAEANRFERLFFVLSSAGPITNIGRTDLIYQDKPVQARAFRFTCVSPFRGLAAAASGSLRPCRRGRNFRPARQAAREVYQRCGSRSLRAGRRPNRLSWRPELMPQRRSQLEGFGGALIERVNQP